MKGLEPSTFCMASRPDAATKLRRSTTNVRNHAGLGPPGRASPAWLRIQFSNGLGHEWGTGRHEPHIGASFLSPAHAITLVGGAVDSGVRWG